VRVVVGDPQTGGVDGADVAYEPVQGVDRLVPAGSKAEIACSEQRLVEVVVLPSIGYGREFAIVRVQGIAESVLGR
jgi:hypothetical protein